MRLMTLLLLSLSLLSVGCGKKSPLQLPIQPTDANQSYNSHD